MSNINIVKPTNDFEFDKLVLGSPTSLTSQTFFSKLTNDNQEFFIVTPMCKLKNGFISSSKTTYCDLMFQNSDEIVPFMENFENVIQKMIYARREKWFHDTIEMDDIENIFTSPLKSYRSGKYFTLRVFTNSPRNIVENNIRVYDQYDNDIGLNGIQNDDAIVCVLHINGLKFSSKIFQVYFELKQVVVLNKETDPFSENIIVTKKNENGLTPSTVTNDESQTKEMTQQGEQYEQSEQSEQSEHEEHEEHEERQNTNNILDTSKNISIIAQEEHKEKLDKEDNEDKEDKEDKEDLEILNMNIQNINEYQYPESLVVEQKQNINELSEVDISMPKTDDTFILNNKVANDIKDQRKELYYKAKTKAVEARLNALKMIAEANNLKNTLLLDNELLSEYDENEEEISLGDLDELSDTQSEYSTNEELNNNDNQNMENQDETDNIILDVHELNNLHENENIDNDSDNESTSSSGLDSTSSSELECEPEKITIHY